MWSDARLFRRQSENLRGQKNARFTKRTPRSGNPTCSGISTPSSRYVDTLSGMRPSPHALSRGSAQSTTVTLQLLRRSAIAAGRPAGPAPTTHTLRYEPCVGGPEGIRTLDLFHAMEARSQLRHRPTREVLTPREYHNPYRNYGLLRLTKVLVIFLWKTIDSARNRGHNQTVGIRLNPQSSAAARYGLERSVAFGVGARSSSAVERDRFACVLSRNDLDG